MSFPEPRLIIFTNDATILGLADFPFYISRWGIDSTSLQDLVKRDKRESWILKTTLTEQLKTINPDQENPKYLTIHDRMKDLPQGYKPKITWIECVTPDGDYLKFRRETIKTKNIAEKGFHSEILYYMDKVWDEANNYYTKYQGTPLENKMPSILILNSVNGNKKDARNLNLCWHIYDLITQGGSDLAKMPICIPVHRSQVSRNVFEYQVIQREISKEVS